MKVEQEKVLGLTPWQQRVLKLLFKFRFVSAQQLAIVMGIRRDSTYEVLEGLVAKELVDKVYKEEWRLLGRPAYYYLNKSGVTTVRKLLDVKEVIVNSHYKNATASEESINHHLTVLACYTALIPYMPKESQMFAKAELGRFTQFPKTRPDLYIHTPDDQQAMIIVLEDKPNYIIKKRFDEILSHFEDEGWEDGNYPQICFIFKDANQKNTFLYGTAKKLENMGMDKEEITVKATHLGAIKEKGRSAKIWSSVFNPKAYTGLFE